MAQHIYLLRHGKVAAKAALYGATDVEVLAETNQSIAQALIEQKLSFDTIYSSPLRRCKTLAQLILSTNTATNTKANEVTVIDDFKEMSFGVFDGVPFDDIYQNKAQWQLLENFWQSPSLHTLPQAELMADFYQRVVKRWQQGLRDITTQKNTLVVCHGGVIRMILASILKEDINQNGWYQSYDIPYGSLTQLILANGDISVGSIAQPFTAPLTEPLTEALTESAVRILSNE